MGGCRESQCLNIFIFQSLSHIYVYTTLFKMELPPDVDPKRGTFQGLSEWSSGRKTYRREDFTDKERVEFKNILAYIIDTYTDENSLTGKEDDKDITGVDPEKRKWSKYTEKDTKISEAHAILITGAIMALKLHNYAYKRLKSKIKDESRKI